MAAKIIADKDNIVVPELGAFMIKGSKDKHYYVTTYILKRNGHMFCYIAVLQYICRNYVDWYSRWQTKFIWHSSVKSVVQTIHRNVDLEYVDGTMTTKQ